MLQKCRQVVPAKRTSMAKNRHPGVVLVRPDPARRIGWRGRYRDPDSGCTVKETLPERTARTVEGRDAWAATKSRESEVGPAVQRPGPRQPRNNPWLQPRR
jgi:hypothetical protein